MYWKGDCPPNRYPSKCHLQRFPILDLLKVLGKKSKRYSPKSEAVKHGDFHPMESSTKTNKSWGCPKESAPTSPIPSFLHISLRATALPAAVVQTPPSAFGVDTAGSRWKVPGRNSPVFRLEPRTFDTSWVLYISWIITSITYYIYISYIIWNKYICKHNILNMICYIVNILY